MKLEVVTFHLGKISVVFRFSRHIDSLNQWLPIFCNPALFRQPFCFHGTFELEHTSPRNEELIGKLKGLQLVKQFPALYGTRWFITAFTRTHNLFLS
jgi:hypothetical protein